MRSLLDVSIRTKMLVLLAGVVSLALVIDFGVSTTSDARRIKAAMAEHHAVLADVLGANSTLALNEIVLDKSGAEQVLSSLHLEPAVTFACTYDAKGKVFATYQAKGSPDYSAPPVRADGSSFNADGHLEVFKQITEEKKILGTVYLRVSMKRMNVQISYNTTVAVLVLIAALAVALLLGGRLQGMITQPIYQLVQVAETVSQKGDYSLRAIKQANDELGVLCDGFNAMLAQIQKRDAELEQHRFHLEKLVQERTRELEGKTRELGRSNTELEQFANIAAHDLQEPLRKVQSFGDLLAAKAGATLGEEERDYLKRMQAAANRMQVLVNDLLTFARVASQAKPFEGVDLNRIVREVLSDLETRVKTTGGRVEIGALPQLESDPLQIRQLLQNLIGKALKFHRPDVPPVLNVEARVARNGDGLTLEHSRSDQICEITVRDNGIGFEENTWIASFSLSNACTAAENMRGPAWAWPSAARSSNGMAAPSPPAALQGRGRP